MNRVQVDPSEMVVHGSNINVIAGKLNTAIETANTTSAADTASAFGALCAPLVVPILTAAEEAAKGFISAAKDTAGLQGQAACDLAATYTATDQDGQRRVDQATDGLETSPYTGAQS